VQSSDIVSNVARTAPEGAGDDRNSAVSRIGRPRARQPLQSERSPRDEIVSVATRLFAEQGFAQTTMSEIARAAGLQQSSLYYWFARKELILQAVFAVNRCPLEFIERIGAGSGSPALKLYRLIRFDMLQLCASPCDALEVATLAVRQPDAYPEYWRDRQRLHDWVVALVRAGMDEDIFIDVDPDLAALGLLSFDEGLQHWARHADRHRAEVGSLFHYPGFSGEQAADFAATNALRGLLRRVEDLQQLQGDAAGFDDGVSPTGEHP
jgi:AcrR family transcriptional regulator